MVSLSCATFGEKILQATHPVRVNHSYCHEVLKEHGIRNSSVRVISMCIFQRAGHASHAKYLNTFNVPSADSNCRSARVD